MQIQSQGRKRWRWYCYRPHYFLQWYQSPNCRGMYPILLFPPHRLMRYLNVLLVLWRGSRENPSSPVDSTCWYVYVPQTGAVQEAQMDKNGGYESSGHWQELEATETSATLTRHAGSNVVTLTVDPKHPHNFPNFKKATIPLSSSLGLSISSLSTYLSPRHPCRCWLKVTLQMLPLALSRSRTVIDLLAKAYAQTGQLTALFSTRMITLLETGLALCVSSLTFWAMHWHYNIVGLSSCVSGPSFHSLSVKFICCSSQWNYWYRSPRPEHRCV